MSITFCQIGDVGVDEFVPAASWRLERLLVRHRACTSRLPPRSRALARSWIQLGDVGVGRAAVGRVVFEAAVFGRVVRGRDDDAVGQLLGAAAIVHEDRARDHRRRREPSSLLNDRLDAVGRQHFQCRSLRRPGQRVRVLAHVKRAVDALAARYSQIACVIARICASVNVPSQRRAAMAAGAEADELLRIVEVRLPLVIGPLKAGHIDQQLPRRRLAGQRMNSHLPLQRMRRELRQLTIRQTAKVPGRSTESTGQVERSAGPPCLEDTQGSNPPLWCAFCRSSATAFLQRPTGKSRRDRDRPPANVSGSPTS